ncbi:AAA family ATPase [Vibrio crassostreae]|uniref:AAA family ATPase n=1 Tax=Vibrio crassostreae TaxID=246167 RepID=UPI000F4EAE2A|nr:AAA family ATPase [Vibrio crassostreae]RPF58723.1 AAA15 family ATPase/GTPase [Vibrio crassostreae]
MLEYINIQNFRSFKKLKIEGLSRINLISGKNNAGKTALLESFQLHVSNFSSGALYTILAEREEFFSKNSSRDDLSPLKHFYYGHTIENSNSPLALDSNLDRQELQVGTVGLIKEDDKFVRHFDQLGLDEAKAIGYDTEEDVHILCHSQTHGDKSIGSLFNTDSFRRNLNRSTRVSSDGNSVNFVPSGNINPSTLSELWDRISLTDLEDHVLAGLQIIEPRITGITFVQADTGLSRRVPIVRLKHISEPVTLRSLGDGMTRICHIILSLVNSVNGTLLIDEFENGLHWSVQEKIWEVIFKLSIKHNIQVIATSHSRDCISSFSKNWSQKQELGSFYRMEVHGDGLIKAVGYSFEDLEDSIEFDVEVR